MKIVSFGDWRRKTGRTNVGILPRMMLVAPTQTEGEPSDTGSSVVTFVPLAMLAVMFVLFVVVLRQSRRRASEALTLYREMLTELRAIRSAVERGGAEPGGRSPAP